MLYRILSGSEYIQKTDDDGIISNIPNDPANRDWAAYQAWLADGNEPLAAE